MIMDILDITGDSPTADLLRTILENQKRLERKINYIGIRLVGSAFEDGWGNGRYDLEGHSL